ncbi:MAG TPA: porin [Polyangiaceae bacterium]|nr:porin [Polyangiaceae bacterium]
MMWKLLALPLALAPEVRGATAPAPWLSDLAQRVDVYGRLDANLALSREDVYVANNGSRFGIQAEQSIVGKLKVLGKGEWRMNIGKGDTSYNISDNPNTGFSQFESTTSQALTTRLGFVGLSFGDYGTLTLGKQWGVYYDISFWTDQYAVFGARGSSTYNAGTDGGETGGGRANDALIYRVDLGKLQLGAQAQFIDSRSPALDGLAGSLIFAPVRGLRLGVAYSHSFLDLNSNIVGYDRKDAQAFTAGITFERDGWKIAALDTWTHDHELVATDQATVAYDTLGAELFVSRRVRDLFLFYAGFDFAIPQGLDTQFVDPNFGTRDLLAGARWLLDVQANSFVYAEGRTGQTRAVNGQRAEDVLTLGIRFNYSLRRSIGL